MPGILDVPNNAQDEHEIAFSKDTAPRESERQIPLHQPLETPVEEVEFQGDE